MAVLTLPFNSVVTVRHEYKLGSDVSYNVLHYRMLSCTVTSTGLPSAVEPPAAPALTTLANSAYGTWSAAWDDLASEDVTYTSCSTKKTFPGDKSQLFTYVPDVAAIGAQASESLPMQDCFTILKKTDYGARWGMGRIFLSGIPESQQTDGVLNSGYMASLTAITGLIGGDLTANDGTYSTVWRPVVTNVPTTLVPHVNDIQNVILSDRIIKTQRRRRPGKGI